MKHWPLTLPLEAQRDMTMQDISRQLVQGPHACVWCGDSDKTVVHNKNDGNYWHEQCLALATAIYEKSKKNQR
ncbi:hypothetical protein [Pseudogemmobacter sp. W21_MBD1_M6]|uniref:hypothetical protein n=1 Tax=Pseudogemmobacter sp. W21_MBD1_M6 TaxID=3240271 RepID=UPI003F9A8D90